MSSSRPTLPHIFVFGDLLFERLVAEECHTIYVKCAEVARSAAALIDKNLSYRKLVSVVVTPFKVIQSHRCQYQSKARMRLIPISE